MANPLGVSKNKLHLSAAIIPLLIFAAFSPGQTNPPGSEPATAISCSEIALTCRSLCEEARSADSRAAALENIARDTRMKADAATAFAQSLEKEATLKQQEIRLSEKKASPWIVKPIAKPIWQGASFILQLLVPKEDRNRYRQETGTAGNNSSGQTVNKTDQLEKEAAELLKQSETAIKSAEEYKRVASDAGTEALQARSSADSLRRSYEECRCREESK